MAAPVTEARVGYRTNLDHLEAELRLLDLVILRAVVGLRRNRPRAGVAQDPYVSDEEVDRLLDPEASAAGRLEDFDARIDAVRSGIDGASANSRRSGVPLPLADLTERLPLTPFEAAALVVCLAPELDRKYERLYAFLQDDVTRKRPSVDLVTTLLCRSAHERWRALRHFSAHAPLRRHGLLEVVGDPYSPPTSTGLGEVLRVPPRVVAHLVGEATLDASLAGIARLVDPDPGGAVVDRGDAVAEGLAALVERHARTSVGALVVHLSGRYGSGQVELAHAVAARLGPVLVEFDGALASAQRPELDDALEAALRDAWLLRAPALLTAADQLVAGGDGHAGPSPLDRALVRYPGVTFVAAERPWPRPGSPPGVAVHEVALPVPDVAGRTAAWSAALSGSRLPFDPSWADELAGRFRLTPGQVRDAAAEVGRIAATRPGGPPPGLADWYGVCRTQSSRRLAELAQKLSPPHTWDDLVVDAARRDELREMCAQVRHRERVLSDWGFGGKTVGHGLAALFAGPPGTGKTMAAGVVANELQLDLYRIDLSQVVSKYIGETEKNLARIFAEAEASGAVLFFDEADALFGKRTEISDAHDRYANIETSYLLQRMEEYEGVAILASNLRQNMDDAFLRRLRFVVEFPFPDPSSRLRIWQGHLRAGAPLGDDVDMALLADRLAIPGGNIRNIVLAAAFLAAAEGAAIGMRHLLHAGRREFEKVGKLWPDLGTPPPPRTRETAR